MSCKCLKVKDISLDSYCLLLSKKNNSILYKLEDYLGSKLLDDERLETIRDLLLTVSADIKRLPKEVKCEKSDCCERL